MANPCLSCGACCAYYRVAFYWAEAEPFLGGSVPPELTVPLDPHRLAMRGTAYHPPRCAALQGEVGSEVLCTLYRSRPSPCRELQPSWRDSQAVEQCDRARAAHDLAPLEPEDHLDPDAPRPCQA